jgi:hypothetical protein
MWRIWVCIQYMHIAEQHSLKQILTRLKHHVSEIKKNSNDYLWDTPVQRQP